ncbi:MAG: hypothetical protein WKF47_16490 [Geodermatophilaceae bacterium]
MLGARHHNRLLGSVSQMCTSHPPCPVVVVPAAGRPHDHLTRLRRRRACAARGRCPSHPRPVDSQQPAVAFHRAARSPGLLRRPDPPCLGHRPHRSSAGDQLRSRPVRRSCWRSPPRSSRPSQLCCRNPRRRTSSPRSPSSVRLPAPTRTPAASTAPL